jgi:structure-specific endonuclease subunit SLX1
MNPSWITDFEFHCCYLINPGDEKHKNKCYIGYSHQPDIRIRQHNRERKGGAKKTGRYQNW